jgi:hypothetical protein
LAQAISSAPWRGAEALPSGLRRQGVGMPLLAQYRTHPSFDAAEAGIRAGFPHIRTIAPLDEDRDEPGGGAVLKLGSILLASGISGGLLLQGDGAFVNVYIPYLGSGRAETPRRGVDLRRGGGAVLARSRGLRLLQGRGYGSVSVVVPEGAVAARMAEIEPDAHWARLGERACLDPRLRGLSDIRHTVEVALGWYGRDDWLPGSRAVFDQIHADLIITAMAAALARATLPGEDRPAAAIAGAYRARDYVMANLGSPLTPAGIAAASAVSLRALHYSFARAFGCTVGQFVRDARLDAVRRMLAGGGIGIAEAAAAVGFHHHGQFAAAYRQRFGERPSDTAQRRGH